MLDVLRDCCEALLCLDDGFWVTAALTGYSFETAGSVKFRRALRSFVDAGLRPRLAAQLTAGVNGNLASLLEQRHPHLEPFLPNRGRGRTRPDIRFGQPGSAQEVIAEVKAVFDLTIPAFYGHKDKHGVADDRDKLLAIRSEGFTGQLYQIVFFVQLPSFDCPVGEWYPPQWKRSSCPWRQYPGIRGIARQYQYLRQYLIEQPVWPSQPPSVHPLRHVSAETLNCMARRFAAVFHPDDKDWTFCPERHLADAAAGCAIWRY